MQLLMMRLMILLNVGDNSLSKAALEVYKIYPDMDNELLTQFTCPRCSKVTTWGVTRRSVQKQLYERYKQ